MLLWLILFWFASSTFAGTYISGAKGRQPLEGFFLGLIFGPVGLIVAVLMPTLPPRPDDPDDED
jgi:hypothetical protein